MPPPGMPKPDAPSTGALLSFLETELGSDSGSESPRCGKTPLLHRLSRTDHTRTPFATFLTFARCLKEVDVGFLLPADNSSSGFDNIADLLFISPSTMERYIDAAHKIPAAFAVGDPKMPVLVNIYKLDPEHPQDDAGGRTSVRYTRRHRHSQRFPGGYGTYVSEGG